MNIEIFKSIVTTAFNEAQTIKHDAKNKLSFNKEGNEATVKVGANSFRFRFGIGNYSDMILGIYEMNVPGIFIERKLGTKFNLVGFYKDAELVRQTIVRGY